MTSFIFRNVRLSFCDAPYLKKDLKDRRFEDGDLGNQKLIPINGHQFERKEGYVRAVPS